jgi:hypothetical protein
MSSAVAVQSEFLTLAYLQFDIKKEDPLTSFSPRIFEAYASFEKIDSQNDLVIVDGLLKAMQKWFNRGAVIMDSHTNRHVGNGLEFEKRVVDGVNAIWLKGEIFSTPDKVLTIDDEVWKKIQDKDYQGLSIGGYTFSKKRVCDQYKCHNVIPDLGLYEISTVGKPANGGALFISKELKESSNQENNNEIETIIIKDEKTMSQETSTEVEKQDESTPVQANGNNKIDIFIHSVPPQTVTKESTKVKNDEDCEECDENESVTKSDNKTDNESDVSKELDFCTCPSEDGVHKSVTDPGMLAIVNLVTNVNDTMKSMNESFNKRFTSMEEELEKMKKEYSSDKDKDKDKDEEMEDKKKTSTKKEGENGKDEDEEMDEEDKKKSSTKKEETAKGESTTVIASTPRPPMHELDVKPSHDLGKAEEQTGPVLPSVEEIEKMARKGRQGREEFKMKIQELQKKK